jgi:hypothetical protein
MARVRRPNVQKSTVWCMIRANTTKFHVEKQSSKAKSIPQCKKSICFMKESSCQDSQQVNARLSP